MPGLLNLWSDFLSDTEKQGIFSGLTSGGLRFSPLLYSNGKHAMKALLTLALVLCIGTLAQAQDRSPETRVEPVQMERVPVKDIQIRKAQKENGLARLYRRAGSRVRKELSFRTKKDQGMA